MVPDPMKWLDEAGVSHETPPLWWSWIDETGVTHILRRSGRRRGFFVRCSIEGPIHFEYHPSRTFPTCMWCIVDGTSPRYDGNYMHFDLEDSEDTPC